MIMNTYIFMYKYAHMLIHTNTNIHIHIYIDDMVICTCLYVYLEILHLEKLAIIPSVCLSIVKRGNHAYVYAAVIHFHFVSLP